MASKFKLPTPEEIAAEEKEAAELGISIFQLRHRKKMHETIVERRKKAQDKRKKATAKKKQLEKERAARKREKEKLKKQKEKELEKEKKKIKEQKKKEKILSQPKKRRVGRPSKRGPKINYYKRKKKRLELEKKKNEPKKKVSWNYKIVACKNGKQIKYIDRFITLDDAYIKINELLAQPVIFPKKIEHRKKFTTANFEYLILEHKTGETSYLRNEYGKLVEQVTNSEKWSVLDKFPYEVEETFWVWGFNNNTDRKTFQWIYDNILVGTIKNAYDIRRIVLFKNKIIFMHDDDFIDIIFTKSEGEAIRFYNKLEEFIERDKVKQVFFIGSFNALGDKRRNLEELIMKTTGWGKNKVQLSSTFKHLGN